MALSNVVSIHTTTGVLITLTAEAFLANTISVVALNAYGNDTETVSVSVASSSATAPSAFTVGMWTVADAGTSGDATVTVLTLPSNNGAAITAIQYRINGGTWTAFSPALTGTGTRTISGLTDNVQVTVELRAVNSVGAGADSDDKTVTPTDGSFVGAQRYVSLSGNDTTGTGTSGAPWRTVQHAVNQLVPGDTLNIADGTFGGFNVTVSGTASQPITIRGTPGSRPLIDGRVATGLRGAIHIEGKDWLVFRNFDVTEGRATAATGPQNNGIYVEGIPGQLHGNILFDDIYTGQCDHSGFHIVGLKTGSTIPIDTYRLTDITIRNCEVTDVNRITQQEGITVGGGVTKIIVEDCFIHDSNRYGMDFKLGVKHAIARRNYIVRCNHHGIYLDCASRRLEDFYIYDNVLEDNATNGICLVREAAREPGAHVQCRDGWIWNNRSSRNLRGILAYQHGTSDIVFEGDMTNIHIFHNTFVDNSNEGYRFAGDPAWVTAVVSDFHVHNNIVHGNGTNPGVNQFGSATGFTIGNNVTTDPNFVNRAASPPNLHIAVGGTADGAGSEAWDPASALTGVSAWFLANHGAITNTDADGVTFANPPAAGAFEAV